MLETSERRQLLKFGSEREGVVGIGEVEVIYIGRKYNSDRGARFRNCG